MVEEILQKIEEKRWSFLQLISLRKTLSEGLSRPDGSVGISVESILIVPTNMPTLGNSILLVWFLACMKKGERELTVSAHASISLLLAIVGISCFNFLPDFPASIDCSLELSAEQTFLFIVALARVFITAMEMKLG